MSSKVTPDFTAGSEASLKERQAAFQILKPACSPLLQNRKDAKQLAPRLLALQQVLATLDQTGLQSCIDYVLLPLLYIADSTEQTRGRKRPTPG